MTAAPPFTPEERIEIHRMARQGMAENGIRIRLGYYDDADWRLKMQLDGATFIRVFKEGLASGIAMARAVLQKGGPKTN